MFKRKLSKKKLYKGLKKYQEIEQEALNELSILKDYYIEENYSNIDALKSIQVYLSTSQKGLNYFGLRGLFPTVLGAIVVYVINTQLIELLSEINGVEELVWWLKIIIIIVMGLFMGVFISIFLLPLILLKQSDRSVRKEIFKNEIMMKTVEKELTSLEQRQKRRRNRKWN
ncbi:hypothetical protein FS935_22275 [Metabacillus litoralis]|uniref:Uncharacterized protein n=1 Tax=Metabacillus litoralis TaxID=152268 RepID=A0A5C6V2V6_9BACI|nr:hypothetical protein [Metabacillus litoralis]TXC79021.1 hypothetical protein FS935_22275 [Metabacillus litoralis]